MTTVDAPLCKAERHRGPWVNLCVMPAAHTGAHWAYVPIQGGGYAPTAWWGNDDPSADSGGGGAMTVHPACVIDCRHRCPACRMGLVSHLRCDPLCLDRSADSEEAGQ